MKKVPTCLTSATLHTKQYKSSYKKKAGIIVITMFHPQQSDNFNTTLIEILNLFSSLHE